MALYKASIARKNLDKIKSKGVLLFFNIILLSSFTNCKKSVAKDHISDYKVLNILNDSLIIYVDEFSGEEIKMSQKKVDKKNIKKLTEPQKALLAFYSAMGGSNCDGESCELTTALGFGKQGSKLHKSIIEKYFPDDKAAKVAVEQDCYLRPSGASSFSEYSALSLIIKGDTVNVHYSLQYYNHGDFSTIQGPDMYVFKDNIFNTINRNLWKEVE